MLPTRKSQIYGGTTPIKEELSTEVSILSRSPSKKLLPGQSRDLTNFTPKTGIRSSTGIMSPLGWASPIQEKGFGLSPLSKFGDETGKRKWKGKKNEGETIQLAQIQEFASETPKPSHHYDYSSLIMCFPESIQSLSVKNANKPFVAFSELTKTVTSKHDSKRLEDILKNNAMAKTAPTEGDEALDKRELMKKVLEYNKIQKQHYMKQISTEKRNILLPLIKQIKTKARNSTHIKVLPSRKLYEDAGSIEMVIEDKNSLSNSQVANSPPVRQSLVSSASASSLMGVRKGNDGRGSALLRAYEDKGFVETSSSPVKSYKVYWVANMNNDAMWKPDVREGHTFTTVGKQVVLYGGLSTTLLEETSVYDPARNLWEKLQVNGDIPLSGRHGHTACEYKKSLVIFGGEHQFNNTLNVRECLNDIRMFTLEKKEWKLMKTTNQIMPRRHHAATVHNHSMIVYGGVNSEGHYMKDVWALNLRSFAWDRVDVTGDKELGLSFHSMCACYVDRGGVASSKDKDKLRVAEEGIYVFGGKNPDGKILNTLKVFSFESKTPHWSYPVTKGIPPTARYNHTSIYYEPLGLFIVYGGRNDHLYESANDVCLNDIRILNLEQMSWSQASGYGDAPKVGRYRHAVASFGSRMLIFGGVEFHKYADDEVKAVELNQARIRRMIMDPEGEMSHDRSKSLADSHGPILKDKRGKSPELENSSTKAAKQFVSFLPLPGARQQFEGDFEEDQVLKPAQELSHHERNILSRLG